MNVMMSNNFYHNYLYHNRDKDSVMMAKHTICGYRLKDCMTFSDEGIAICIKCNEPLESVDSDLGLNFKERYSHKNLIRVILEAQKLLRSV